MLENGPFGILFTGSKRINEIERVFKAKVQKYFGTCIP